MQDRQTALENLQELITATEQMHAYIDGQAQRVRKIEAEYK